MKSPMSGPNSDTRHPSKHINTNTVAIGLDGREDKIHQQTLCPRFTLFSDRKETGAFPPAHLHTHGQPQTHRVRFILSYSRSAICFAVAVIEREPVPSARYASSRGSHLTGPEPFIQITAIIYRPSSNLPVTPPHSLTYSHTHSLTNSLNKIECETNFNKILFLIPSH